MVMKKILMIIVMLFILAALSAGLWAYKAFFYTKPLNQAELAELTPDWSVVTHGNWSPWFVEADGTTVWNPAASFNAWLATVPEEDKAWPVLVDVQYAGYQLYDNLEVGKFPEDADDWGLIVALCGLDESKEMIDRLKEALQRPVIGAMLYSGDISVPSGSDADFKYTSDPAEYAAIEKYGVKGVRFIESTNPNFNLIGVLLPSLGKQRLMANLFRTYGIYELEREDVDEFVELVTISMDSADITPAFGTLIGQLVAIAIEQNGMGTIRWAFEHYPEQFTDEHLLELDQLIARHQGRTLVWQGEAFGFHDTIRRMVDDSGSIKMAGARTLQGGGGSFDLPSSLPDEGLHASSQRTLLVYNKILKQAHIESVHPLASKGPDLYQTLAEAKKDLNAIGYLLLDMLTPAMGRASERFRRVQEESIELRITIAAHRHALRHGELPASNEDIDDDLLPD